MNKVKIDLKELLKQDSEEFAALSPKNLHRREFLQERIADTEKKLKRGQKTAVWSGTQFNMWKAANKCSKSISLGIMQESTMRFDPRVDVARNTDSNRFRNKSMIDTMDRNEHSKGIDLIGKRKK